MGKCSDMVGVWMAPVTAQVIMTLLAIGLVLSSRGRPRHRDAKFPWLLLLPVQPYWMNDQMINNDRIRSGQMRGFF